MLETITLTVRERRHIIGYMSEFDFEEDSYSDNWRDELEDVELVDWINSDDVCYEGGYNQFKLDYANIE